MASCSPKLPYSQVIKQISSFRLQTKATPGWPLVTTHSYKRRYYESEEFLIRYREPVDSLLFAAISTRPDIYYDLNQVSQYSSRPTKAHWNSVLRILHYLKSNPDFGICFAGENSHQLTAYGDADYAANSDTRCSTTGFELVLNGGPISWGSQRQRCTSLSTTEAEYVAQSETSKEVVWVRRLLMDLGFAQQEPTPLLCDN